MNTNHVIGAGFLFFFLASSAYAQTCPTGSVRVTGGNTLRDFVTGKTVCATHQNKRWQEFHNPSGNALIDYKRGANDPVDPSKTVGTWAAANGANANVTYNYGTGGTYTYIVCAVPTLAAPTSYTFVGPTTITGATFRTGPVSCN